MKKLLSLLSVLTISGTAIPTTIAASPYQKEETINYQQTNNLENLIRNKRDNKEKILYIDKDLIINLNNPNKYESSFREIIQSLINNNILIIEFEQENPDQSTREDTRLYSLNSENYDYFVINVYICHIGHQSRNLQLVFRTRDIYLEGIIVEVPTSGSHHGIINNYYHFSDSDLKEIKGTTANSVNNNLIGNRENPITGHYRNLLWSSREYNQNIYWEDIYDSFFRLTNLGQNFPSDNRLSALDMSRVILVTSEALRFRSIYNLIINNLNNTSSDNQPIIWGNNRYDERNIAEILLNWRRNSNEKAKYLNTILIKKNLNPDDKLVSKSYENKFLLNLSLEDLTEFLSNQNSLRILITSIVKNFNYNKYFKKSKRNENLIISEKINVSKILDENTAGGHLKAGDIYVGTENGVYLIHGENKIDKFNDLNFPIIDIKLDGSGSVYVVNNSNEIYHLNLIGWGSKKLERMESSNLEKEIILYYNDNKSDLVLESKNIVDNNKIVRTFNLGKINPLSYKKIEILGNESFLTKNDWGGEIAWGEKTINSINDTDTEKIIRNYRFYNNENSIRDIGNDDWSFGNNIILDKNKVWWWNGTMWFEHAQTVGFTFYWENKNNNYYLQFLSRQHAKSGGSNADLKQTLRVGNRIRLYND